MSLKPESSLMVGLATATVVYGIYQSALPNLADVRSLDAKNGDVAASERLASWTAAGVVAGISLLAQDMTVFVIGSVMVTGMAWWHRHANEVSPLTGKALGGDSASEAVPAQTQAQAPAAYAAPQYDATIV
jgi:hypothetical protein